MEIDKELIIKAETLATGANVHSVNEAIANYEAWVGVVNGTAWFVKGRIFSPGDKRKHLKIAEDWEKYLRILVSTGVPPDKNPQVII